jgi:rhodanese-related sulfurtransferase
MSNHSVPNVPEVAPVDAWKAVSAGDAVILDVREPEELDEVAIPEVTHIPLGQLSAGADTLPRDQQLLVICRSGVRSAYATQFLLQSGFEHVRNIAGGVIAWAEAGLPIVIDGETLRVKEPDVPST